MVGEFPRSAIEEKKKLYEEEVINEMKNGGFPRFATDEQKS